MREHDLQTNFAYRPATVTPTWYAARMHCSDNIQQSSDALSELLIPGTDPEVAENYRALAKATPGAGLSLFDEPVIVLDTETTGLDDTRCSLIEIAAARVENGTVVDKFQTFVNPGCSIPAEIVELTGITDDVVAGAPSPREAVAQFASFAGGLDLVAHNASFDRGFIMRQAKPGEFTGSWVDTLAFSQILLPRLSSHRLSDLARAFGVHTPSHRATDDVRALSSLWNILLAALQQLPPGLAGLIARLSPETDWTLRPYFKQAAELVGDDGFSLRATRDAVLRNHGNTPKPDAEEVPLSFAADETIERAFSREGIAGAMYEDYEPRIEQLQMAREVQDALRTGTYRALEAGTGVGKSMAYLVPLALAARENGITVGVATKTNALMDQLVYHELPRLTSALGELDYVALKGYEHYPCLRKIERMARTADDEDVSVMQMLAMLISFIAQTSWGDLDALNLHWYRLPRARVQASANDCLKRRCPFFPNRCYLHGTRRHAACADIVVTNHALLFRDTQMENSILPPVRHWVVDEAHAVEDEARKQLSHGISARELETLLVRLSSTRSGLTESIRKKAANLEGGTLLFGMTTDIDTRVMQITAVETSFFSYVKELAAYEPKRSDEYDQVTLWIGPEVRTGGTWAAIESTGRSLIDKLDGLIGQMSKVLTALEEFEGAFSAEQPELANMTVSLKEAQVALDLILNETKEGYVYSAQLDRNPDKVAEELLAEELDIGKALAEDFYPNVRTLVYTSATLATGDKKQPFGHFCRTTGLSRLDEGRVSARQMASSYDFDHHMSVLLPDDIPEPSQRGYREALADLLYQVHVGMGGSVLTLFTNRREMEALYRQLKPQLKAHHIDLIAQTKGASARALRDRFLKERTLSLFALKSFWEGFDAPGDTLRCVVIPKLPFSRPTDPLSCEREMHDGRAAWGRYALPEAVVDLKQAAGRLIRKYDDEGWLILADARLQTKNYGSTFLRAMPTCDIRTLSTAEIGRVLREEHPGLRD